MQYNTFQQISTILNSIIDTVVENKIKNQKEKEKLEILKIAKKAVNTELQNFGRRNKYCNDDKLERILHYMDDEDVKYKITFRENLAILDGRKPIPEDVQLTINDARKNQKKSYQELKREMEQYGTNVLDSYKIDETKKEEEMRKIFPRVNLIEKQYQLQLNQILKEMDLEIKKVFNNVIDFESTIMKARRNEFKKLEKNKTQKDAQKIQKFDNWRIKF